MKIIETHKSKKKFNNSVHTPRSGKGGDIQI